MEEEGIFYLFSEEGKHTMVLADQKGPCDVRRVAGGHPIDTGTASRHITDWEHRYNSARASGPRRTTTT